MHAIPNTHERFNILKSDGLMLTCPIHSAVNYAVQSARWLDSLKDADRSLTSFLNFGSIPASWPNWVVADCTASTYMQACKS